MCGIVGAVAQRNITPILLEGLKRLEYRGYDSCGVALHVDGQLQRSRSTSRVADLEKQIDEAGMQGFTGIAHTRWATHGAPLSHNAHPHFSPSSDQARIALVHNGIIENHDELRAELSALGYVFQSQTDTEVIAHLVDHMYNGDLFETLQLAVKRLHGAYAIAVFCRAEPHRVVAARQGSPLIVGIGQGENFVASDAMALAGTTDQIIYLEEGDVVDLQLGRTWIVDVHGKPVQREVKTVHAHTGAAELGPYRHYMQKEIFEQPCVIGDTLEGVTGVMPELFGDGAYSVFKQIDRVLILACGTSYYAGLTAKYLIESLAKIPVNVEIASEYRYRDSVPHPNTLVVTISQSGETADTLAALKHARGLGMEHTLTICNVATSAMVRMQVVVYHARRRRSRRRLDQGLHHAAGRAVPADLDLGPGQRAPVRRRGSGAPESDAPPAGRHRRRAGAGAADHRLGRRFRAQGKRPLPRPRHALPDRAGRRAEAQGNFLYPRRSLPGRRAEARPAGDGHRGNAGRHHRAERRADRKAQVQYAGSARARRPAVRVRRRRLAHHLRRGRARDPAAGALRLVVADLACGVLAAAGLSRGVGPWHRRRQAA